MKAFIRLASAILVLSTLLNQSTFAQTGEATDSQMSFLERLDSLNTFKISRGKSVLTPFIAPSYTPELEFMVSAGGLFTFALDSTRLMSRSSVPFSIGYSSNGSLQISVRANIYGKQDKYRITGEFWKKNIILYFSCINLKIFPPIMCSFFSEKLSCTI